MSIRFQLDLLARLQAAQLEARRIEALLADLPARREAKQRRIEAAKRGVADAEAARESSQKTHRHLEIELQDAEGKVDKYREQEMLVRTNEQLWALQAEIKQAQEVISGIEESIIEELERADTLDVAISESRAALTEAETITRGEIEEIDRQEAEQREVLAATLAEVEQLRSEVEDDMARLYERVAAVRGGVAVAEAIDGVCQACNFRLRPQLWLEVQNMGAPVQCGNCQRIMFSRAALDLPSSVQVVVG